MRQPINGGVKSLEALHNLFFSVKEDTETILNKTGDAENSLAVLFRTVLLEQLQMCELLLPHLKEQSRGELKDFKKYVSIIYHDDSIADSTFRAWSRAVKWQDESAGPSLNELDVFFQRVKKNLKSAAKELEGIFGEEKVKYVVPAFYLPKPLQG